MNHNLYAALRAQFPSNLDTTAVETDDGLHYSWRDLERASAMLANLLEGLNIPQGARVAVQVEKSVEAMMLYLATLRAGYVFLPLNTAYQSAEIQYFIENAEPAVVVCSGPNFGWVSKIAFKAGTQYVFTLNDNRTGSLLDRAVHCSDKHTVVENVPDDGAHWRREHIVLGGQHGNAAVRGVETGEATRCGGSCAARCALTRPAQRGEVRGGRRHRSRARRRATRAVGICRGEEKRRRAAAPAAAATTVQDGIVCVLRVEAGARPRWGAQGVDVYVLCTGAGRRAR